MAKKSHQCIILLIIYTCQAIPLTAMALAPVIDIHAAYEKALQQAILTDIRRVQHSQSLRAPRPVKTTLPKLESPPLMSMEKKIFNQALGLERIDWTWPARGRIAHAYSLENKGIDIASYLGAPIYACANGLVVYSGNGIRGYGNLIILKHSTQYFSAYAHSRRVLIHEGDRVYKGQIIAEMGSNGGKVAMLHFEIRLSGQPVDPLTLLS
jgi:lipoprotein NlpD